MSDESFNYFKQLFIYCFIVILFASCISGSPDHNTLTAAKNIEPGKFWLDTDGKHINAHGGGMLYYNNVYYWFGEHKVEGKMGNRAMVGVSCYSSTDLYQWKNEGTALQVASDTNSEIAEGCIIERPKVIYNKSTDKFVMWFHLEIKGLGYGAARTGLAVSSSVTGPYTYVRSFRPNVGVWPINEMDTVSTFGSFKNLEWWTPGWREEVRKGLYVKRDFQTGQMSRDMTLFVDDDGKAYHIHSSEENLTLHISELTDDYLDFSGKWLRVFPGGHNEAPAFFKRNGKYYMITSGCTGWDPNDARSAVAESVWGPWVPLGNPCIGDSSALTFNSQGTFVFPLEGKQDNYIFMADRWSPQDPIDGKYVWLPIKFEQDKPIIEYYDAWNLSVFNNQLTK